MRHEEPLKYGEHGVVSWPEYEKMRRERDAARAVARELHARLDFDDHDAREERYPWLREERR